VLLPDEFFRDACERIRIKVLDHVYAGVASRFEILDERLSYPERAAAIVEDGMIGLEAELDEEVADGDRPPALERWVIIPPERVSPSYS
jgi:hypothetical protein